MYLWQISMSQTHYCSINGRHPLLLGHALPTDVDGDVTPRNSVRRLQTQARVFTQNRTHVADHGQVSQLKGLPLISPPEERFTNFLRNLIEPGPLVIKLDELHKCSQFAATCIHSFCQRVTKIKLSLSYFYDPKSSYSIAKFYIYRNFTTSFWWMQLSLGSGKATYDAQLTEWNPSLHKLS